MTAFAPGRAVRAWRFAALVLTALLLGLGFAHVLELPAKMAYGPALYTQVNHTLYPFFAYVGAPVEFAAIIAAVVLAFLVSGRGRTFTLTLSAALLLGAALAVFFAFVQTANVEIATWTAASVPADWMRWRAQWEYGHAAHAALVGAAFGALCRSVLRDTVTVGRTARGRERPAREKVLQ